jgi:hypothetical protein
MRVRTLLVLVSLFAIALVAPAAAVAKRGGTDRPWKGRASGTLTFDLGTAPFPATATGTGHLSHFGKGTYTQTFTITLTGATTFDIAGTQTIVAANGDSVSMTFTGSGELAGPFGVGQTSETTAVFTVTGGTGRFDDATGTLTSTVLTTIESIAGADVTATQNSRVRGRISY